MKKPCCFIHLKSRLVTILLFVCICTTTLAKNSDVTDTIRIDQEKLSVKLIRFSKWYLDGTHAISPQQLPGLYFRDTIPLAIKISPKLVQTDIYLKFIVTNQADTSISFYFSPGIYFKEMDVYQLDPARQSSVKKLRKLPNERWGFKEMELAAHQTGVYFARLQFAKTNAHNFAPVLIRDYFLNSYISNWQNTDKDSNIITFVFSGVLLMMIFYSIAVYMLNRSREFLYYACFAFCLGLMFFMKSFFFKTPSTFNNFFEAYLDFVMQSIGTFIYLSFLRRFLETKKNFPLLHKILLIEQGFIIASIVLFSYLYFDTDSYGMQNQVETFSKLVWSIGTIIFIIYTIRKKNKLLNYLAIGHTFLLVGGLISLYLISSSAGFRGFLPPLLSNALLYYELGLAAELMFFLTALAFKNRADIEERTKERENLQLKTERQDLEKQLAVLSAQQDERNRISADMHDELGSGVTAIRLMSEILKSKMKDSVFPEIEKISNSANDLIIKMNTLIWTMKSENDSIESLVTYIRIYALEFFENTSIECQVNIPLSFARNIELTGEKRRSVFLSVKETLNNILKHSRANKVHISFQIDTKLVIFITDDGIGIDFNKLRQFGSGLNNIKKRIEGIDGTYKIENNAQKGARTTLELKL